MLPTASLVHVTRSEFTNPNHCVSPCVLKTSEDSEKFRRFGGHEIAKDILPRVSGKKSAERRVA